MSLNVLRQVSTRSWLVVGLLVLLVVLVRDILLPFVLAAVLAYLLLPLVSRLQRWGVPLTLAVLLVVGGLCAVVIGGVAAATPTLLHQMQFWLTEAPVRLETLYTSQLAPLAAQYNIPLELQTLLSGATAWADEGVRLLGQVWRGAWASTLALVNVLSLLLITPVVLYYFLKDAPQLQHDLQRFIPAGDRPRVTRVLRNIDLSLARLLRGQLLVCILLGLFYGVSLHLYGLNLGLLIGLGTGLLSFIPLVGMVVGVVVAGVVALVQYGVADWVPYAWIGGIFVVGQMLEGMVLQPRFAGQALGLHPVWIMFTVFAGGALGGLLGVLIALPVAAVLRVLVHEFLSTQNAAQAVTKAKKRA